jgi:hypothetical protein
MNRVTDRPVIPKVHWLIVDEDTLIPTVKELEGIEHPHITTDEFFVLLEQLRRAHPLHVEQPVVNAVPPEPNDGEEMNPLPDHVVSSMRAMKKRRDLIMDVPRLMTYWPTDWPGYPNLLVVSVHTGEFSHVGRVPEAFHFLADAVCVIKRGQVAPIRQRGDETMFDKVAQVFPMDTRNVIKAR